MTQIAVSTAYIWSVVIMVVCFFLALIFSNQVQYTAKNSGTSTRKIIFWVFAALTLIIPLCVNMWIASDITVPAIKGQYTYHTIWAAGIVFVVYVLAGFAVSKLFPTKKVGTWF